MALPARGPERRSCAAVGLVLCFTSLPILLLGCPIDALTDGNTKAEASPSPDGRTASDTSSPGDDGGLEVGRPPDAPPCLPFDAGAVDDCNSLVELLHEPIIDGVLECGVPLWPMPLHWGPRLRDAAPTDENVQLGAAWKADGLYLYVEVTRSSAVRHPAPSMSLGPNCGDAVELFIDSSGKYPSAPAYNNPGTAQFICPAPPQDASRSTRGYKFVDSKVTILWSSSKVVMFATAHGFTLEGFFQAADLGLETWPLERHGQVGLDVQVDVGDPYPTDSSCPELGEFYMNLPLPTSAPSGNVLEFCNPTLNAP